MKTDFLEHRHGGRITALHSIAHETYKGVASWHFIGSVEWSDGSTSADARISPNGLCTDGTAASDAEANKALHALSGYLASMGEWHDAKHHRNGMVSHWTPRAKTGVRAIEEFAEVV